MCLRSIKLFLLTFYCVSNVYGYNASIDATINQAETENLANVINSIETHLFKIEKNILGTGKKSCQKIDATVEEGLRSDVKNVLEKYRKVQSSHSCQDEHFLENISNGLGLALVTLDLLNRDMEIIKQNISNINNVTSSIMNAIKESNILPNNPSSTSDDDKTIFKNCKEIKQKKPYALSGIYEIKPRGSEKPFKAFCEMYTENGGWTVIQNRKSGIEDFYMPWLNFKMGFGNLGGDFWFGLEKIYLLTSVEENELLIELVDQKHTKRFAYFSSFGIGSEAEGYPLKTLGSYQGTAGDSLSDHKGMKFSTYDKDQDSWAKNCAETYAGGWWHKECHRSNLNGKYLPGEKTPTSMCWWSTDNEYIGLYESRILIRPKETSGFLVTP